MFANYCVKKKRQQKLLPLQLQLPVRPQCSFIAPCSIQRTLSLSLSLRCFWQCDVRTVHDSIYNESMTPLSLFSLPGSGINNELWSVKYHPRAHPPSKLRSVSKLSESFCLLLFYLFIFCGEASKIMLQSVNHGGTLGRAERFLSGD